jgi:hypothetical protein
MPWEISMKLQSIRNYRSFLTVTFLLLLSSRVTAEDSGCSVVQKGARVEIRSPFFVYQLDTQSGLRAEAWENRLTGRKISLSKGSELEVDIGEMEGPHQTPEWQVAKLASPAKPSDSDGEAVFVFASKEPALSAQVVYRWNSKKPVLRKFVQITNTGAKEIRVLNVRLGTYRTEAKLTDRKQDFPTSGIAGGYKTSDREPGFPLYLDNDYFLSLAHPAGWATADDGTASLRQYPGVKLAPGAKFDCMETVYGVGQKGEARKTFLAHLKSRMRRVVRGHDKPYAIFDNFGSWPSPGDYMNTEAYLLDSLGKLAESQKVTGRVFDLCNIHFWFDMAGDLKGWDPKRFPNGIGKIKPILDELGIVPGLWIDSSWTAWSIGQNPAAKPSLTDDPTHFCRASEPIKSMYREAFIHHIRNEGVRLIKFDNLHAQVCKNPKHDHLPGLYSMEAIYNSVIEFFNDLDKECPDVFLILYWGYRSPWWLLHGDTIFDSGLGIEGASPSSLPSPYARDSVTQKLDQAHWHSKDVPMLGKDSLGIFMSNWGWNSSIGKERWQEGYVMDICRGSMLAQLWADYDWLSPPEWIQLADLTALLKAAPKCFGNPRFILGNPIKDEPYGYCCTDGCRAFLAIDNCTWQDRSLTLELNSAWGLPDGNRWDLYRWYPEQARLAGDAENFGPQTTILLRPFEVVLLEAVPAGQKPTLERSMSVQPIPAAFAESSREVKIDIRDANKEANDAERKNGSIWTVLSPASAISKGGATLTKQDDGSIFAEGKNPSPDTYTVKAESKLRGITGFRLEVLPDSRLPSQGPGRVYNGNFALNEFSVSASSADGEASTKPIPLQKPSASFSQTTAGNWPIEAAIDSDPNTAWSIDPLEGEPHVAVFETREPVNVPEGGMLIIKLAQGYPTGPAEHTIGRFRLSATTAKPPIPPPVKKGPRRYVVQAQLPATSKGGIFVVTAKLTRGAEPAWFGDIGTNFSSKAKLGEHPIQCQPVLGKATYASSWEAWRIQVEPSPTAQTVELSVSTTLPGNVECNFAGHFLPR